MVIVAGWVKVGQIQGCLRYLKARQLKAIKVIVPSGFGPLLPSEGTWPHIDVGLRVAPIHNLLRVYEPHIACLPGGTLHVFPVFTVVLVDLAIGLQDAAFAHNAVVDAPQVDARSVAESFPQLGKPPRLIPLDTITGVKRVVLLSE